jgi:hypothetical protein
MDGTTLLVMTTQRIAVLAPIELILILWAMMELIKSERTGSSSLRRFMCSLWQAFEFRPITVMCGLFCGSQSPINFNTLELNCCTFITELQFLRPYRLA